MPAAKQGDRIEATDIHIVMIPSPGGPVPTPLPNPFSGLLQSGCSENVLIAGMPAATVGSGADNLPPHIPEGGPFENPPTNRGTVLQGSSSVLVNGKPAARSGDAATTCNDPAPAPVGVVVAEGTVLFGG